MTAGLRTRGQEDAVLSFPASGDELFVNSAALELASAYFKTLLEPTTADDLDHEDDGPASFFTPASDGSGSQGADSDSLALVLSDQNKIVISDYSYELYHAVMVWLLSGYIHFSPLTVRGPGPPSPAARSYPGPPHDNTLPAPVSAAAAIHLATELQLFDLVALAIDSYKSQLTIQNVMSQVSSSDGLREPVKEVLLEFGSRNWRAVKQTPLAVELRQPGRLAGMANGAEVGAMMVETASRD